MKKKFDNNKKKKQLEPKTKLSFHSCVYLDQNSPHRKRASSGSIQRSVEVAPCSSTQSACRAGSLHSISTSSDGSS